MANRARAWDWLHDRTDVDVALLQEASEPPDWACRRFSSRVWRPKHGGHWGSAVLSRSLELEPHDPTSQFPWHTELAGSTAIARSNGEPTWLVSVHLKDRQISRDVFDRVPLGD